MAKDDSVVKSFRTTEDQFRRADEIFRKEGFSFSEVIRLLFDATIREGRIPRSLSTRDIEDKLDDSKRREEYIDSVINMAVPASQHVGESAEEKLLRIIFGETDPDKMSNAELREWGNKLGLPDTLSVSTLADLYDCGYFPNDPWGGAYDCIINPETTPGSNKLDENLANACIIMKFEENIKDNLDQLRRKMQVNAVKYLLEYDNMKSVENKEDE